jgi:cell division transport system permease protein
MFYSVLTNFQHIVRTAEEGVSVTVFFKHGVTEEQIDQIRIAVEEREEVAQVNYVSAEDAWASFSEEYLGEYAEGFTENPLEDSANLEIYLSDISKQSELVSYLESLEEVRMVNRSELTANTLSGANRLIGYASIAIIGILLLVAVFLISNTIATGIQSHKDEINIMKYIGATDLYVRGPYVFEGLLLGFLGSLIPLVVTYFVYNKAVEIITSRYYMLTQLMKFLPVEEIFTTLIPISVILGVGIGFVGSILTIRKHLHV